MIFSEKVRKRFPKIKYNKSDDPQIEDDSIDLDDIFHIQICGGNLDLVEWSEGCFKYHNNKSKTVGEVIEIIDGLD